jgi:16S rRNA processing protein RimM
MEKKDLIIVGKIIREWGIKGEILVSPLTYDPKRYKNLKEIYLEKDGSLEQKEILEVKFHKENILLKIKECATPEVAKKYRGALIKIRRSESPELPKDTYYYYDIIGMDVHTVDGAYLGKIDSIMKAGECDVYTIKGDKAEHLIPAIKDVIKEIDLKSKRMIVKLPEETEAI